MNPVDDNFCISEATSLKNETEVFQHYFLISISFKNETSIDHDFLISSSFKNETSLEHCFMISNSLKNETCYEHSSCFYVKLVIK
jgi:hypothetical protein